MRAYVKTAVLLLTIGCSLTDPSWVRASALPDLDKRISMDVEGANAQDILNSFEYILGIPIDLDPAIEKKFSIRLQNVRVETLLNAICESAGCEWDITAGETPTLRVNSLNLVEDAESPQEAGGLRTRVSMDLKEAPAEVALGAFVKVIEAELEMDPSLAGRKVTIKISDAPAQVILMAVCHQIDCEWEMKEDFGNSILVVWAKDE